jgi:hypothetical protein
MKFQGFVGPAYTLKSVNVDCQRCVNLYPEIIESGTGKEGQVAYLKSTPGLRKLFTVGDGPIRLILADDPAVRPFSPPNRVFVVSGNKIFRCAYIVGTDTWETLELGELETSTGPVRGVVYDISVTDTYMVRAVFVDGDHHYEYFQRKFAEDPVDEEVFESEDDGGFTATPNPTHVVWLDGYFIFTEKDTNKFWVSAHGNPFVDALDFASAEGDPDKIVSIIANNRDLWIFNEKTTEVWSNTGNAAFPFERVSGGFIEKGCVAPNSVAKIEGIIFWLGRDEAGQGVVYAVQGLTPARISTHAVEQAISSYADISSATAFTYQSNGHSFYILNFAEATWVYDFSTKLWHERAFTGDDDLERHRADCHAFFPDFSLHLVGDYETGDVYALDDEYYTDDETAITRLRVAPHVSNSKKRLFCKSLEIDMETGVGLDGAVLGSDPQVMMDFSDDGGHTWSSESWVSAGGKIGGIGDFMKRVIWRRLGCFYDRVFRIKITDPIPVTILGAEIDVEPGNN